MYKKEKVKQGKRDGVGCNFSRMVVRLKIAY